MGSLIIITSTSHPRLRFACETLSLISSSMDPSVAAALAAAAALNARLKMAAPPSMLGEASAAFPRAEFKAAPQQLSLPQLGPPLPPPAPAPAVAADSGWAELPAKEGDHAGGRKLYFHAASGMTTFEKPRELMGAAELDRAAAGDDGVVRPMFGAGRRLYDADASPMPLDHQFGVRETMGYLDPEVC